MDTKNRSTTEKGGRAQGLDRKMKKNDWLGWLIAHGQAFAIGFLVIVALSISMVVFLLVVLVATWFNRIMN